MSKPIGWQRERVGDVGDVGGDTQYTEAWGVRWVRQLPDGRIAVTDRNFYAAYDNPNRIGPVHPECQTIYTVCTDPADVGGTEQWSDIRYETLPGPATLGAPWRRSAEQASPPTPGEWRRAGGPALTVWPNPGSPGYQALMGEVRMQDFDDPWATASEFCHAFAGVAYVRFGELLPDWEPGAYSEASVRAEYPDSMIDDIVSANQANLDDLRRAYKIMTRYRAWVKLAGRDY